MSKYLWVLIIVCTLILIQVANEPAESFALDPNSEEVKITEPNEIAEANQAIFAAQKLISDANDKKMPAIEDVNSTADANKAEDITTKVEANATKIELPDKKTAEKAEKVEPKNKQAKLSEVQKQLYEEFSKIFADYVGEQGKVDYGKLRRQRLVLKSVISMIENLKAKEYEKWEKEDKIAFWINTYNLHKLKAIIENYPIEGSRWLNPIWGVNSIRHIKNELDIYKFIVMNEEFTFDEVERRFFKDLFKEPRVFFAITMCTKSSPPMHNRPYQGIKLNEQLDDQIRNFLADESIGFKADEKNEIVYLPLLLKKGWYGSEFVEKYSTNKMFKDQSAAEMRAVLNFVTDYIPETTASFLKKGNYSVRYLSYNWLLNE